MKQRQDPSAKPYYKCLSCARFRKTCGGIPTRGMDLQNWCEYMRDVKESVRPVMTNAYIANEAEVSIKTIERIMSGKIDQDIYRDTARRIEDVIIGSSNQYPCYLAFEEQVPQENARLTDALRDLERALEDNRDYRKILDSISESHRAELQTVRDEAQTKITYLRAQVERLQRENDNLWAENNRKSKLVDRLLEKNSL